VAEDIAVGLKDRLRRAERQGDVESFELVDGSRFYYDRMEVGIGVFLHTTECLRAHDQPEWPQPPEIIEALTRAKHREAAFDQFFREAS